MVGEGARAARGVIRHLFFQWYNVCTFILEVGARFSGHCRCGEVACWVERRVNIWNVRRDEKKWPV